jgi:hypothetical protein
VNAPKTARYFDGALTQSGEAGCEKQSYDRSSFLTITKKPGKR